MNRIENYGCFKVVAFEIFKKKSKMKKMYANYRRKSHENENRPKNDAYKAISWSTILEDSKTQCQLKD